MADANGDRVRHESDLRQTDPPLMGLREAAAFLRLNPRTLSHLAQHGRVPARKVGGVWRFHRDQLERWLAQDTEPAAGGTAATVAAAGRPRVLVIDDDPGFRDMLRFQLGERFDMSTAPTAAEGLLAVGLDRPDLIIVDLILPDLNGREICRLVRARPELRATGLLVLSGVDSGDEVASALKSGADDYVTKPFRPVELQARVQRLLERTGRIST